MSFINRVSRALDSFKVISNDEITNFGMSGERKARRIIDEEDGLIIYNPIIPHPRDTNKFLETDAIIYNQGNIYAIEIKNYKGEITFIPKYKMVEEQEKFLFFFTRTVRRKVQVGWDDSKILKKKVGNYNEDVFYKEYPNPMKKTKSYIYNLKGYLSKKDRIFNSIFITPVVAFNRENTNIENIHSIQNGYIYIDEIPKYIAIHSENRVKDQSWIKDMLKDLPTWDTLTTNSKEQIYGVIKDSYIELDTNENIRINIKYKDVKSINFERNSIFSKEDLVTITFTNGKKETYKNIKGTIMLNKFGDIQEHKISNLSYIDVGTWMLRKENYI